MSNRPLGCTVAQNAAKKALDGTITYDQQDCQAFVERCVIDTGGKMAYAGSNDMYRHACTWLGTIQEARAQGKLTPGALLFIHAFDGGEPDRYKGDGKGNASHVGLYCDVDSVEVAHSGKSVGHVAPSTLSRGWTHVGLAREIAYDAAGAPEPVIGTAVVATESGALNIRQQPSKSAGIVGKLPRGATVDVIEDGEGWASVLYGGVTGWASKDYLRITWADGSGGGNEGQGEGGGDGEPTAGEPGVWIPCRTVDEARAIVAMLDALAGGALAKGGANHAGD